MLDFGLSRRMDRDPASSSPASILADASVAGTLTHIAPEVLRGQPVDARVDLWALGVMLYEMASGVVPFAGTTPFETAHAILHEAPRPLPSSIPLGLRRVIDRCLAKDSAMRFASAAELKGALEAINTESPRSTFSPAKRRTAAWRAGAAVVALAAAAAAYVAGGRWTAPAVAAGQVLAVLPFDDASAGALEPFFASGLTEGLTAELGRIERVRVISSGTTMRYQSRTDALGDVARDTGANLLLRGSMSRAADRVRVMVELLEAKTGRVIWSDAYERPMRTLQALHGTIAQAVSAAIAVELTQDDRTRFSTARAVDPEVYAAYLKGRYHWNQRTAESLRTAVAELETALALDPTYAPAYAALADCYNLLGHGDGERGIAAAVAAPGGRGRYQGAADRSGARRGPCHARLRPALQLGVGGGGTVVAARHRAQSEQRPRPRLVRESAVLAPRLDEAVGEVGLARELDPLSLIVNTNVGWVLFMARRNDEAIAQYVRTLALDPTYVQAHTRLGDAYFRAARPQEAIEEMAAAARLANDSASTRVALAQAYALAGQAGEAERLLSRVLLELDDKYVSPGAIANAYVALGQDDKAFDWLERSYRERANNVAYLAVEPLYDRIRQAPRFRALVQAVRLP